MKTILMICLLLGLGTSQSLATEDHTPEMCAENTNLCLHLGFHEKAIVGSESKFMVHFMVDPAMATDITDVQVELTMDMGNGHNHGTAPVEIKKLDSVHYLVSKAYFVMEGEWTISVFFKYQGQEMEIIVPYIVE